MFFPTEMSRVTVVSHRIYMEDVIKALYEADVLHLKDYVPREGDHYPIGAPLPNAEKISELLLTINAVKTQLVLKDVEKKATDMSLEKAEKFLNALQERVSRINNAIREAEAEIKANSCKKEVLDFLTATMIKKFDALRGYGSLEVMAGYVPDLKILKERMSTLDFEMFSSDDKIKKGFPVVVLVRKKDAERLKSALQFSGFCRVETDLEWKKANVSEENEEFSSTMKALDKKLASLRSELAQETKENGGILLSLEYNLTAEIRKSEVPLKFAVSKYSFMIQGWVPNGRRDVLEKRLKGITENLYLNLEKVGEHEEAPILLKNKGPVKPFEFFLRLYSLPSYKEIDPTFILFMTYPIIFGIMLGDIGYGLVLFAGFAFIKYKMKKMGSVASVLMLSSLVSVLFGFIYGEFFGFETIGSFELHPMIMRAEGINAMLPISLIIGIVHLNIGIAIALVNELRERKFRHALGKASWFVLETGGILYLLETFFKIPTGVEPMTSLAILLTGVVLLTIGESYRGLIEIPALASNVLSYARIAALGLAGVQLALIINGMAGGMFHAGGFMIIGGVALLFTGHAVNTLLSLMGCFLQSLRLHYVEMFSKFYHGDGEPYKPFGSG
jgi:V/A-type H+-transporting ATPase subunit I